jgi:hypothetical protein
MFLEKKNKEIFWIKIVLRKSIRKMDRDSFRVLIVGFGMIRVWI